MNTIKQFKLSALLLIASVTVHAQATFQKSIGGTSEDFSTSLCATSETVTVHPTHNEPPCINTRTN